MKRATCTGPPSGEPVQVVFISRRRPAGAGLVGEDLAGGDLVHEFPQNLVLPFPLHQASGPFWRLVGGDLVHETPQALVPPFPLHQVSGPFRRGAGGELVHEFPQAFEPPFPLHQVSGHFRRGTGGDLVHEFPQALVPPFPLHQVSGHFRRGAGEDLVYEFPQALVPPFPLHQVSDSFRPAAGHVGAWLPAKPYSTVRSRQHRRRLPGAWPTKLAPGSPQSHIPPSGHANTDAVFPARGRLSWRLALRKAFVFRQATPTPAAFSRPAVGALDPEDVVLGNERIMDCGEWRTTSAPPSAPWPRKTWCPATKE